MKQLLTAAAERFWLFTIAAIALAIIGFMVIAIVVKGKMPEGAGEFFGAAITGLLLVTQKVIDAQQARRMSDQLAQSRPAGDDQVTIANDRDHPVPVKGPNDGDFEEDRQGGEKGGTVRRRKP